MRTHLLGMLVSLCLIAFAGAARGGIITFNAILSGTEENPSNASPATGFGTVVLDDVAMTITVDESWSDLTAPATASHIHTAPLATNGPVTFSFAGVPSATSGSIPEQVFSITAGQMATLEAGGMYMNVHSSNFPGGEIRGQLVVPEPTTLSLLAVSGAALLLHRRRA